MDKEKQKVIAIVGPTASGKSALGVYLAQKLGGEVISADSRQVYKGLDIGTGKITKKEMSGIPHHLLDVASTRRIYSVSDFQKAATKALQRIVANKKIPIVVGGTGLYADVLLGRMSIPEVPPNEVLRAKLEKKTVEQLFAMLQKADPERATTIEPKHKRRLIRALEISTYRRLSARSEGKTWPSGPERPSGGTEAPYDILWLGLNPSEKVLNKKIHTRLLARMRQGMVAEAKRLHARGLSYKRMEALGLEYRALACLLRGSTSRKEMLQEIERDSAQYVKRQMRWFKRNKDIRWITQLSQALSLARAHLAKEA